jgi:hypothetical protein
MAFFAPYSDSRESTCSKQTAPFPLNVSYVCPEPVLAKRPYLCNENGAMKRRFPHPVPSEAHFAARWAIGEEAHLRKRQSF